VRPPRKKAATHEISTNSYNKWQAYVRMVVAKIMKDSLVKGDTLLQATVITRAGMFSHVAELREADRGTFTSVANDCMGVIMDELMSNTQLTELQQLRTQTQGFPAMGSTTSTFNFILDMTNLLTCMVDHIIRNGAGEINEDWQVGYAKSLRTIKGLWEVMGNEGIITRTITSATPTQAWSSEQLNKHSEKSVTEVLTLLIDNIPKLENNSEDHVVLLWMLLLSRQIISIEVLKRKESIYERVWLVMPRKIFGLLPHRFDFIKSDQILQTSPYTLMEVFIQRSTRMIEPALARMKEIANDMVTGPFWDFANFVRDAWFIEELKNFTSLRDWVSKPIPILTLKHRIYDIPNLDHERRIQLGNKDDTFEDMVERLKPIKASQSKYGDRSALQIHAIQGDYAQLQSQSQTAPSYGRQNQKNGSGLAQSARRTIYKYNDGQRSKGKGRNNERNNNERNNDERDNKRWSDDRGKGRRGKGKGGKGANRKPFGSSLDRTCTWNSCQDKPSHLKRACPEWLSQTCNFPHCKQQRPHTRSQCVYPQKEEASQQDHGQRSQYPPRDSDLQDQFVPRPRTELNPQLIERIQAMASPSVQQH
jgi:hypothetical protein